ncbi:hypothetical protein [Staphylospora marina]|uniref:hypothetical protein n=1 Tax=Staphylospora marina TaxID=2490858 RepID=UPI001F153A36|nr:hypothetical protein [Staphylospora marina]
MIRAYKCRDAEERIPVLRRELDRELDRLADALKVNCRHEIERSKQRLMEIRREMILLEAL